MPSTSPRRRAKLTPANSPRRPRPVTSSSGGAAGNGVLSHKAGLCERLVLRVSEHARGDDRHGLDGHVAHAGLDARADLGDFVDHVLALDDAAEDAVALAVGGLGMGIIGAFLPLTLFSGEAETVELIGRSAEIGVAMLIVLGIAKLFATSLLLATGWKGGYIFPIMFTGVAMGLAASLLFPDIPAYRPGKCLFHTAFFQKTVQIMADYLSA